MESTHIKRYSAVVASTLLSLGCGTIYTYSAYSTQLARLLHLTATQTSVLGLTGNLGASMLGSLAGIIVDKSCPAVPVITGAVLVLAGFGSLYLCCVYVVTSMSILAGCFVTAGFGCTLLFQTAVKTVTVNFPQTRGSATGLPISAYGLSALIYSLLGNKFWPGDAAAFVRMLAVVPFSFAVIALPFLKVHTDLKYTQVPHSPVKQSATHNEPLTISLSGSSRDRHEYGSRSTTPDLSPHAHEDLIIARESYGWRLFGNTKFWGYFVLLGLLCGGCQMYIYCCGYMVLALGSLAGRPDLEIQRLQGVQVAVCSVANFAGRLCSGIVSDVLVNKCTLSRLWLVVVSCTLALAASVTAMFMNNVDHMWQLSALVGVSYGIAYGSYPPIVSEVFGLRHFSQNWGWVACGCALSSSVFITVFGKIYDSNNAGDLGYCVLGSQCYSLSMAITATGHAISLLAALWLLAKIGT